VSSIFSVVRLRYVGLWHGFELISKTDQFGEYKITAFTSNAIQVEVEVTIQYQVQPTYENLYKIIFDYDDMGSYFDSRVKDAVRRGIQSLKYHLFFQGPLPIIHVCKEMVFQNGLYENLCFEFQQKNVFI